MNIKRGLLRIWMVFSLLWVLVICSFSYSVLYLPWYTEEECVSAIRTQNEKTTGLSGEELDYYFGNDFLNCTNNIENWLEFLKISLIPVFVLLIGGWGVGFLTVWIVKGFRKDHSKN